MKKYIFLSLCILTFSLSLTVLAKTTNDLVFMPDQLWYSGGELKEGQNIKIHTALWNGTGEIIKAKIEFYDKSLILGSRDVSINPQELKEVSVSWEATAGAHTMSAKIISPKLIKNGKEEDLKIKTNSTGGSRISVPVTIRNEEGEEVNVSDTIEDLIDKAEEKVGKVVSKETKEKVYKWFNWLELYRQKKGNEIISNVEKSQKELDNKKENEEEGLISNYAKLYFWKVFNFIFNKQAAFYVFFTLLVLGLIRAIYRSFRYR